VIQDLPGICTIVIKNGVVISNSCSGGEERPRPDRDDRNRGPAIGAPQKPPAQQPQPCVNPNWLQHLGIKAQGLLAKLTGKTVGVGAGGSGAIGRSGLGVAGGVSRQVVVSPNGQAAFEPPSPSIQPGFQGQPLAAPGLWEDCRFLSRMRKTHSNWVGPLFKELLVSVLATEVEWTLHLGLATLCK